MTLMFHEPLKLFVLGVTVVVCCMPADFIFCGDGYLGNVESSRDGGRKGTKILNSTELQCFEAHT